jgi:hypothetical protein
VRGDRTVTRAPIRQQPAHKGRVRRNPVHPDDVLKALARSPHPVVTPKIEFLNRNKPPANPYVIGLWAVLGLVTLLAAVPWVIGTRATFAIEGIAANGAVPPADLGAKVITVTVKPGSAVKGTEILLDGKPIEPTHQDGNLTVVLGASLAEGEHELTVQAGSRILYRAAPSQTLRFRVDGTAPEPTATLTSQPESLESPIELTGTSEPGATVTVNDRTATVQPDGNWSISFPRVPIGAFRVNAVDAAGNAGSMMLPGLSNKLFPAVRGVHVSAAAWAYPPLKNDVLQLVKDGKVNTIQLDLKDEDGRIGHRSNVPLVNQIGSSENLYDLKTEVEYLKSLGVRVVGRLVVFRDPTLAKAAWEAGRTEQVLQTNEGKPYAGKYGGKFGSFTNPFDQTVRNYNTAVALEAAQAGVDDILLDYIRRPESQIDKLKFIGAPAETDSPTVSAEIVEYVDELARTLHETPARLGASVFGVAISEGDNIAQNIPQMSKHLDYLSPMIYPSSWGKGQLGVANPPYQPYEIIVESLKKFQEAGKGTGVKMIPWLQDFNLVKKYGTEDVRAQIVASADVCVLDWLMWDPKVTYTTDALPVGAQKPSKEPVCPTE